MIIMETRRLDPVTLVICGRERPEGLVEPGEAFSVRCTATPPPQLFSSPGLVEHVDGHPAPAPAS
jgi:hypothetical protein